MCKAGPGRPQEVKCLSVSEKSGLASKPGASAYSGLCASTQLCASTPWQLSLSQSYGAEAFIPVSPQGLPAQGDVAPRDTHHHVGRAAGRAEAEGLC